LYAQSTDNTMGGMSRALTAYHLQLAESRPRDYARVLAPMQELIVELVEAGAKTGRFRADIEPETLAIILMQTLVAATHMHALGAHLTGEPLDAERLWAFCLGGLTTPTTAPAGAATGVVRRAARAARR
ncbi:MAG: hypothetical protein QOE05_2693, partial [Actinomycetota bacterium]|nr:hypothetical protein [Actinomycetota bacterium]